MRVLVALTIILAGCAQPIEPVADVPVDVPMAMLTAWDGGPASVLEEGHPLRFSVDCSRACSIATEAAPLPDDAYYEIFVRWDGTQTAGIEVVTEDEDLVQRGFDSIRVLRKTPQLEVVGDAGLTGRISILGPHVASLAGDHMLPNIVTYQLEQIHIGNCDDYERREQGALRCLRLGNAIGNTGDGPLQAVLPWDDGALTPAGLGSFDQRIPLRGGGFEDRPVGNADIHLTHGHFHYDGFARFSLFEWDPTTGLRGELAAEHKKSGFCFLDWGQMEDPDRAPGEGGRAEAACQIPGIEGWTMGVSAGYFDFYWEGLTDQYVEITGVSDGYYELVSEADWNDSLAETDEEDNLASAIIRIEGDDVEVLEDRSFYVLPENTRQL